MHLTIQFRRLSSKNVKVCIPVVDAVRSLENNANKTVEFDDDVTLPVATLKTERVENLGIGIVKRAHLANDRVAVRKRIKVGLVNVFRQNCSAKQSMDESVRMRVVFLLAHIQLYEDIVREQPLLLGGVARAAPKDPGKP